MKINEKFKKWAVGFSGMDGGNPKGPFWFCGIEYGGGDLDRLNFIPESRYSFNGIPCWNDQFRNDFKGEYTKWQFNQKISKIACVLEKRNIKDFKEYMTLRAFNSDGNTFKMNLYPLNFSRTDDQHWVEEHFRQTGFPNKISYRGWCMEHRFPFIRSLVKKYSPKVVVCTGTNFSQDFKLAFLPEQKLFQNGERVMIGSHKPCEFFYDHKTLLVITPFLGPGGLMSDEDLKELGQNISKRI